VNIHIVCRNWKDDRVLPRFTRYLMQAHGWTASAEADPHATVNYLVAYFEYQKVKSALSLPFAAYMTHREEGDNAKSQLYDQAAGAATLRVAMNQAQLAGLKRFGNSMALPLPLETENFVPRPHPPAKQPVVGLSGYTYANGRKGEALISALKDIDGIELKASGRGWSVPTKMYKWHEMPDFYRSLDLFVCTSLVEGGPMTTLEALSCGVPVVIPSGVGIHDELPKVPGIYRYARGDTKSLIAAVEKALRELGAHKPDALRNATEPHSVEAWCRANIDMFETFIDKSVITPPKTTPSGTGKAGVYVVAFGEPARAEALRCINSIHKQMKGIPVALCSDRALGPEDVLIQKPDADIGGRIAKLSVYDYAPQDWEYILYLDADIEIVTPAPMFYFDVLRDGWEFAICKDAHLHDTLSDLQRRNNFEEVRQTIAFTGTGESLQINGGAWSFRRNANTKKFFALWLKEWNVYKGRDQGALIRALYTHPLRTYWLGSEWNTLITLKGHEYPPGKAGSAGVLHRVGKARRWTGQVPAGKGLTDPEAWAMVKAWEASSGRGRK